MVNAASFCNCAQMATKKDFARVAYAGFQQAVGEAPRPAPITAKQENSRKNGQKSGKLRSALALAWDEQRALLAMTD